MKSQFPLSVFVSLTLLFAAGVVCLLGALRVVQFEVILEYAAILAGTEPGAAEPSLWGNLRLGALGGAVALLALLGLAGFLFEPGRRGQIAFAGSGGQVSVATTGLEEFIRRAAGGIRGVQESKAKVKQRGNDLSIEASVVIGASRPVMEITEEIQNRIRSEVEQRLGLPKVGKIRVHVSRMMPELERSRESAPFSAEEE